MASWDYVIRAYVRDGLFTESLKLFRRMRRAGGAIDHHTLAAAAKASGRLCQFRSGGALHALSFSAGFVVNLYVQTALLDLYARCGALPGARRLFDEMPARSIASWNCMISACARNSEVNFAFDLLRHMRINGFDPNMSTLLGLLPAKVNAPQGLSLHCHSVKLGLTSELFLVNALTSMYAKLGMLSAAVSLFSSLREDELSAATWTTMVNAYVKARDPDRGLEIFNEMRRRLSDSRLDEASIVSLLSAATFSSGGRAATSAAHAIAVKSGGGGGGMRVANSLVNAYSKCRDLESAAQIFTSIPEKDVVSWTAMITGYAENGGAAEAAALFEQMTAAGVAPTCRLRTALVDMYCKGGGVELAREIFSGSAEKDVALWSSMMNGYAMHGRAAAAMELFEEMAAEGIDPDGGVFTSLLSACRHAGLVNEGLELFRRMRSEFRIEPCAEHYVCMADLLGRGGHVDVAMQAAAMAPPGEMQQRARAAALSAAGGDAAAEMGEREAESCEVQLVTFRSLASMGRWEEAAEVRRKMEEKGLVKEPGWSRLELADCVT